MLVEFDPKSDIRVSVLPAGLWFRIFSIERAHILGSSPNGHCYYEVDVRICKSRGSQGKVGYLRQFLALVDTLNPSPDVTHPSLSGLLCPHYDREKGPGLPDLTEELLAEWLLSAGYTVKEPTAFTQAIQELREAIALKIYEWEQAMERETLHYAELVAG